MKNKFDDSQKSSRPAQHRDTSALQTMVGGLRPKDDLLDSVGFSADVASMKAKLSRCTMSPHESENPRKVNLENLVNNMMGVGKLELDHFELGRIMLYSIRTRRGAFLISQYPPESLYEDPVFMSLATNLRDRSVLYTQKNSPLYLYPLGSEARPASEEIRQLQVHAKRPNGKPSLPPPEAEAPITDTFEVDPDRGMAINRDNFKKRFARCVVLSPEDRGFDPKAFAETITLVSAYRDLNKSPYYLIITIAGENEDYYLFYINADSRAAPGKGIFLQYGNDYCVLYRVD